jgi:Phosphotransferase enzyme family
MELTDEQMHQMEAAAGGASVVTQRPVASRGYSNNRHFVVRLSDDRPTFVKQAVDAQSAKWLRAEYATYSKLKGPWLPEVIGWHDDGEHPVLLLEDLSDCSYPPPWTPERIDLVRATLADLASYPLPPGFPPASQTGFTGFGWSTVADDPEPFLGLGMCSRSWLDEALPVLLEAATLEHLDGDSVVHLDVRSDNMFFRDDRVILVDWNLAAAGNPEIDVAFWLPSVTMEGGPEPDSIGRLQPEVVALVAGFFAGRAGLPIIPTVPKVRDVQRRQLEVALPWAVRGLDLPPLR